MVLYDYVLNIARNAAGLAIHGASSAVAKTSNTIQFSVDGDISPLAAADVATTNTVSKNTAGQIVSTALSIADQNQVVLTVYGVPEVLDPVTLAVVTAATTVLGKGKEVSKTGHYKSVNIDKSLNDIYAIIGYIYIKNETGAAFVGGTTHLDAANVTAFYTDAFSSLGI